MSLNIRIEDQPQDIKDWLLRATFLGQPIGSGATRTVYAMAWRDDLVVKLEDTPSRNADFCNVHEFELWNEVKKSRVLAKFFAPVMGIAGRGTILTMRRTQPITEMEFVREVRKLPDFMEDLHWANFGRLDGKIVCHDYGYSAVYERARLHGKLDRVRHRKIA